MYFEFCGSVNLIADLNCAITEIQFSREAADKFCSVTFHKASIIMITQIHTAV